MAISTVNPGDSYPDIASLAKIPDDQRIYDRNKEIVDFSQGRNSLARIIYKRFAESKTKLAARDMLVKYASDVGRQALVPLGANSENGLATHDKIWVPNKYAEYIEDGTILVVTNNFFNGTTYANAISTSNHQRESMIVKQRGTKVGANTWFLVDRGHPSGGGAPNQLTAATNKLVVTARAIHDGSNEARVWGDTPITEWNYNQPLLYKWGQTAIARDVEIYQDKTPAQRNGERTIDLFFKQWNFSLLLGRRFYDTVEGYGRWYTGGVDEYISSDNTDLGYTASSNVVNFGSTYGAVSSATLNQFASTLFFWGNSEVKYWIVDSAHFVKIANAFDNKVRIIYNKELSLKYGMHISDFMPSSGGTLRIIQEDLHSIYGLTDMSYIIDFDYLKYMYLQGHDLQIMYNVEKGMNMFQEINYLYQNAGLIRRCPFAHHKVINFV